MKNDTAHYAALQSQLNPHFLFNSLDTLIAEIEYNPGNAVRPIKYLPSVYCYVLQCQNKTLVTLAEELESLQSYLLLYEVHLGDCISYNCRVPSGYIGCMLSPLTLQLSVENVINHSSITLSRLMKIEICLEEERLVVSNPIQPKKSYESPGVGLKSLSNHCSLIPNKEIIIQRERKVSTIKVPLLYE